MMEQFNISRAKAQKMQTNLFKRYPGIQKYQDKSLAYALDNGFIMPEEVIKRRIYLAEFAQIEWLNKVGKTKEARRIINKIFRDASNYNIQSTAATMTKLAGIYIRQAGLKLVLCVHDQVIVECLESEAEKTKLIVEDCMRKAAEVLCKSIEVPAEAKITIQWSK